MSTGLPIYLDLFTGYSGTFVRSLAGRWSLQGNFGFSGGTCVLKIDTHDIRNGFADLIVPGRHSLVARTTESNVALGEWVLTRTSWSSDDHYLTWEGKSWRSLLGQHTAWRASGKSVGASGGAALASCIKTVIDQHGLSMNLAVLTTMPPVNVEWKSGSSIGSTMNEIMSTPSPPRWIVLPVVNETGGLPTTVSRNCRIGDYGDLLLDSGYHIVGSGSYGAGNATLSAAQDWEHYVSYCIGFGAGSNDKQLSAAKSDGTLAAKGMLNRDSIQQFSNVEKKPQLQTLVDGVVAKGQDIEINPTAALKLSEWSGIPVPRAGVSTRVTVHPCTGWPNGYEQPRMAVADIDVSASNGTIDSLSCSLEKY